MSVDSPGPAPREILPKVLELELSQGCRDVSVVGGFSRFAHRKLEELLADTGPRARALAQPILDGLTSYPMLDPAARRHWVEELRRWLTGPKPAVGPPPAAERGEAGHRPLAPTPSIGPRDASDRKPSPTPASAPSAPPGPDDPIQFVRGVGPKRAQLLAKLGIETRGDLLAHAPLRYEDRSRIVPIASLVEGESAAVVARVRSGRAVAGRSFKGRYEAELEDESGSVRAVWFGQSYLARALAPGARGLFYGKVAPHAGRLQLQGPSFELLEEGEAPAPGWIAVYPLTEGLPQRFLRALVRQAVDDLASRIPDPLPSDLVVRLGLMDQAGAYRAIHTPTGPDEAQRARHRLAFQELFVLQAALARKQRSEQTADPRAAVVPRGDLVARFKARLPFRYTRAQARAESEILADLVAPRPMARLLQGEVGSGKTVLAASALLAALDAGQQAALMAPTEILAEQHFLFFKRLCEPLGVVPDLLVGRLAASRRGRLLEAIGNGSSRLVFGTHSLIEPDVRFLRLGLIVIDEQHRFGVVQRARLMAKLGRPNMLVMTATPIPRTLSLVLYGDLDLTVLDELPPGRKPVETRWVRPSGLERIWKEVRAEAEAGGQAYVVCPAIEDSEAMELEAAESLAEDLAHGALAGVRVGLMHGKLHDAERESVMAEFRAGAIQVLVATTVIEVGVDVPQATCMVVLNAERFGLAQLHQLRGRVGRGERASRCWLVSDGKGEETRRRLSVLVATGDGFKVAEEDLRLRGPGELFGTRQSGLPELRFADLVGDTLLLDLARREARAMIESDPELAAPGRERLAGLVAERQARFVSYKH